jgi:uncharacterized membrane protein YeiH
MNVVQIIEHVGVASGAMSGVLASRGKHIDLFGVLVLSIVTAFGGDTLRDLLLGRTPVGWLLHAEWIYTALGAAMFAFFVLGHHKQQPRVLLEVVDGFMLAFFTIAGTKKILDADLAPVAAVVLGVITGVTGGIIRDVLLNEVPLVFQRQTYLYATAAFIGAVLYCILLQWLGEKTALWAGAACVIMLRMIAVKWKLSLPEFD